MGLNDREKKFVSKTILTFINQLYLTKTFQDPTQ